MAKDFLPANDAELLGWAQSFGAKITSTPLVYGLSAAQATAFNALLATYSASVAALQDPNTRTRPAFAGRDAARSALKAEARELARVVNAFPSITNEQRLELRLNPRTGEITPINPPTECPVLEVVSVMNRTVKVKLRALGAEGAGKPAGVDGATLFSFVGAAPPADINDWKFQGSTTRTSFDIDFPPTVAGGAQVWLTAFWFNPPSQSGPACIPVSTYLAGGVGVAA